MKDTHGPWRSARPTCRQQGCAAEAAAPSEWCATHRDIAEAGQSWAAGQKRSRAEAGFKRRTFKGGR